MSEPFEIGGVLVAPGERMRVELPVARLVTQTQLSVPLIVMHGKAPGPRVWISAAIHGDELNGTEIIRRVLSKIDVKKLRGTLVAAPVVNVHGFIDQSRYLPDRRDLNRSFPGSARGSLAGLLAHLFMTEVVARCTHGIDLHTGSNHRTNIPQVRGDLKNPEVRRCAEAFAAPLMIQAGVLAGSLRAAASHRGIPILVYEAGEPLRFNTGSIRIGTAGVLRVLADLEMLPPGVAQAADKPSLEIFKTQWLRATRSGIAHLEVGLDSEVKKGQTVATILDAFGDKVSTVRARAPGIVIGLTLLPIVNRGEAILHVALTG